MNNNKSKLGLGIAIGALGATAVAVVMRHPKVKKKVNEIRDQAMDSLQTNLNSRAKQLGKAANDLKDQTVKKLNNVDFENMIDDTEKRVNSKVNEKGKTKINSK